MVNKVSDEMKQGAMEHWKFIEICAKNPPTDTQGWLRFKYALGAVKAFVVQQGVENNRDSIALATTQYLNTGKIQEQTKSTEEI